jgi:cell division protein FtsN
VTTEPEEIIKEEVTEPTPPIVETITAAVFSENIVPDEATVHHDDDVMTGAITDESNVDSKEPVEGEEKDAKKEKSKEKAGVGFWVTMILIALLIIAGGAYVGRNYNEIKQSIPFLADEKAESSSKSLKEEISDAIKEDKYSNNDIQEDSASIDDEDFMEGTSEGDTENEMESEIPVEPEIVEPKVIETPKKAAPVVIPSPSTPGHYHIIAGAFSSIDNANRLANEFKAKGLPSTVVKNGELNAVSMQSYATSEQAHTDLNKMNAIVPGAWILYK